jgi:peroxiredoxin Q/BCP
MTHLKEGQPAPDFTGTDQNGNRMTLSALKGKKVILYFYPKDFTSGCTAEACNLRDNYSELMNKGYQIIGVSADDLKSHKSFAEKYQLPFSLIPDPEKKILHAYGVWGLKKMAGRESYGTLRTTFVISEDGIIKKIFTKVQTDNHTNQILNALES